MHRQQHLPSHRVQLSEYDESLLLDRSYVHTPQIESSDVSEDQHLPAESFGPLRTGWAVWAYLACVVCYVVFLFVDPFYWESGEQEYAVKASAHVILLALSLLLASFLRYAHRRRQRLGYLRFYRRTSMLLNVPALAAATATAVLLLATLWPHAVLPSVSPLAMLRVVAIAECVVDAVFAALYVLRVVHHNLHEAVPDAQLALEGTLCTLPGGKARRQDVVVEQQGELIRYLQRQRDNLSREVLRLQLELDRHWEQADEEAGAPRVDVEHRLAQREQELRALGAEKEALLKENRATWLLLDERDAEIHRLQANRQQHVEENSRLRGTLEEWSHRNAKLEQRLIQLQAQQDEAAASTPQSAAAAQHSMPGHNALDFSARRSFTPRVSSGGQFGAGLFGGAPLSEREPSGNAYFSPAASAEAFMYTPRSDSGTPAGQSPPQRVFSAYSGPEGHLDGISPPSRGSTLRLSGDLGSSSVVHQGFVTALPPRPEQRNPERHPSVGVSGSSTPRTPRNRAPSPLEGSPAAQQGPEPSPQQRSPAGQWGKGPSQQRQVPSPQRRSPSREPGGGSTGAGPMQPGPQESPFAIAAQTPL